MIRRIDPINPRSEMYVIGFEILVKSGLLFVTTERSDFTLSGLPKISPKV